MTPKIDIQMPEILVRCFYFPAIYGPREKLDNDVAEFKKFFELHGEEVLRSIEQFSGCTWSHDRIPVYLIPDSAMLNYSFSKWAVEEKLPGIIQKIGLGIRDYHIHIHELAHTNQRHSESFYSGTTGYAFDKEGRRNVDLLELSADIVTLHVMRKLFGESSDLEKDFWDFLKNTSEKNKRKEDFLIKYMSLWDLNSHPLKYYLEQNPEISL
jgi:hypothetical protein